MLLKKAWLHLIINKLAEGCFQFPKFISHPQRFFSPALKIIFLPSYTSKYEKFARVQRVDNAFVSSLNSIANV